MEKANGRAKQFGGHAMALQLQSAEPAPPSGPASTLNEADVQSLWEAAQDETEEQKLKRAAHARVMVFLVLPGLWPNHQILSQL